MVIIILEKVPASLRGELSRWMIEPKSGVFIGKINATVREKLWEMCCRRVREGGILQAWRINNEQGFDLRTYGITSREVINIDGLKLVRTV